MPATTKMVGMGVSFNAVITSFIAYLPQLLLRRHTRCERMCHRAECVHRRMSPYYKAEQGTMVKSASCSAHSMRATFITTALDNGASLEDVQSAAGHADPSTTKLYGPPLAAGRF
jgi:site-specific recombinase XerD